MAKKTFVVAHPKLYLKVDGKLSHVEKGTEYTCEEKHAEDLLKKGKLVTAAEAKKAKPEKEAKKAKPEKEAKKAK